ncbi:MAG: insulinase family protein [Vampirovibrionales bacterium]|nr:insulinase family protein [Vampirovibrionales bacterium]
MSAQPAEKKPIAIPYRRAPGWVYTFENGHTLVFVPKPGDVFNVSTWARTGSIHETDETTGISHFLEHLLFKGTARFGPGEFDRRMESMGAVINAATWKDFTFYYVTGPKGDDDRNFLTALDLHADMMTQALLPEEEIGQPFDPDAPPEAQETGDKRERGVVIEEIGMRGDQPWTKLFNAVNQRMYPPGHPYRRDVIGTRRNIGLVPRQTLVDYYRRWYAPGNLITIIVGDLDPDTLCERAQKVFCFETASTARALTLADVPLNAPPPAAAPDVVKGQYNTAFFLMAAHGPTPQALEETVALDVLSYALGEGHSSRMNQNLIEKAAVPLFNFLSCGQSTLKLGNTFYIQGNVAPQEGEDDDAAMTRALEQVRAEVAALLGDRPLSQTELTRAVKALKADFAETSETASGIAESIGESLTVSDGLDYYLGYLQALEGLTLERARDCARRYLAPERFYIATLLGEDGEPQDGSAPQEAVARC